MTSGCYKVHSYLCKQSINNLNKAKLLQNKVLLFSKEMENINKAIKEQKEKIINHYKDFKELNYDIVNSFIDYIEIGEKGKKTKTQDVVIHWSF